MMATLEQLTLPTGLQLETVTHGRERGLPVVFLHGVTDSWRSFEPVWPYLPPHWRAIAYTQRGHGDSSKPESGYSYGDFADDLLGVLDALEVDRAVLVGHSMGTLVGQRFALDHPERVAALVLEAGFATIRGNEAVREFWDQEISRIEDPIDPKLAREFQLSAIAGFVAPRFVDLVVSESRKTPARVWRECFANFLEEDFTKETRRIAAPTLLLWGEQDVFCGRDEQERLRRLIREAALRVYPAGGHSLHWEEPERFVQDIAEFVDLLGS